MEQQLKYDILLAMVIAYGVIMAFRFWPRIQAKMLGVPFVTSQYLKNRIENLEDDDHILIIDVRMAHEFNGKMPHIQGALNLELPKLREKLESLGEQLDGYKDEPIFITCRKGSKSIKAARILFQYGFRNISILKGGMRDWHLSSS